MSNSSSLLLYLSMFTVSALLMYSGRKYSNKLLICLSLAIPIALGSLRYGVGTDYFNYVNIYLDQTAANYNGLSLGSESGFYILNLVSKVVTGDYRFVFAAASFLTILFFYLGLKKYDTKHTALVYFLYLTVIFPMTLNIVRQGIAISICFYAFTFIISQKPIKYTILILFASLFHLSAIILLPLYFINGVFNGRSSGIYHKAATKLLVVSIALVALLPYVFILMQRLPLFERYIMYENDNIEQGNNYTFYLKMVMLAVSVLFYRPLISKNKLNVYFIFFMVVDLILSTLGFTSAFIKRIALYFAPFGAMLLVGIIDIFADRTGKAISYMLLCLYGTLYFFIAYYLMGQSSIFPYVFIGGNN